METQNITDTKDNSAQKLLLGLLFDAIGMLTFTIPGIGEFGDIIWAPIAAFLMSRMYKGRVGKVASVLTFIEEIIPFTDIIPSFTITWIYTYFFQKGK
ncbi:hypothetical protein GON26_10150 [Flavobacterium sp. GA093]|uniref:Uncharacterized protein n=1 Tax=Flavobacterium hydrocarbonoxydans TaxID=2683249 RepID=A0A6I4NJQ1_9FLAO|nr:hypothetical protein [Flavobacterium hydrocarbonoxydans]MWB94726.1 hypothetical protein [Flavobacterium hydrocarbonoxydans]